MSYNIKNFAQTVTYTVNDSTANTNAVSLTLLGKSLPNYGTYFNQNFVWLMENFSSDSANPPPYPVQGQLWWDSTFKFLNVYNGSTWQTVYGNLATLNVNGAVNLNSLTATSVAANAITANSLVTTWNVGIGGTPANYGAGYTDLWIDGTSTSQIDLARSGILKATFIANSGGVYFGTTGISAANLNIMTAISGTYVQNQFTFSTSGDLVSTNGGEFKGYHTGALGANTPNTVVATSVTTSSGGQHIGYLTGALGANTPNSVVATSVTTSSGGQHIGYLTGAIGSNVANTGAFTTITATNNITAQTANIYAANFVANTATYSAAYYWANGTAFASSNYGNTQVAAYLPTNTANIGVRNIVLTNGNLGANIGNINTMFSYSFANNFYGTSFYGTSTTAQYADLAEKYVLDHDYPLGTVVMIGGDAEATQHDGRLVRAIGAVSTNPAYKMNDGLENGTYIALKGRVPIRVIGPVIKGQSLRGSSGGLAIAENQSTSYTFAIAMENVNDIIETTIEAVIL